MCQNSNDFCFKNKSFAIFRNTPKRFSRGGATAQQLSLGSVALLRRRVRNILDYGGAMATVTGLLVAPCRAIVIVMFPLNEKSWGITSTTCHNQS